MISAMTMAPKTVAAGIMEATESTGALSVLSYTWRIAAGWTTFTFTYPAARVT